MSKQQVVTCKECGKRRVKALTTNPITGKQRRSTIKICQDCHSNTIDYKFFSSSFGQWLRRAFQRQCTNSIPANTNELRGLLHLWKFYRKACGFNSDGENVSKTYDYHLCHIDPIKGKDGLVGKLTYSNLMIAPAELNREHSNIPFPYTSNQSVLKGEEISDDNFKTICRALYNLPLLAAEFCLLPQKKSDSLPKFQSRGVNIPTTLSKELKRLGYPVTHIIKDDQHADKLANEVYDAFFTVGGTVAIGLLTQYGTSSSSEMIDYDFTLPSDKIRLSKEKRRALWVDIGF
ncbi:hypothetical protein [Pseudoalteromonas sp. SR43-3]|uniref:hypothetical protein n=1 Tax=Pseudoalteromonas sp. SR43-3 TaxID=2760943 RepID=UPI0016049E1A|nr:hypothetical protein [Pseudoalteromonas sp. SR43-3]MBB1275820.1 hypothetical protein [Pseudoalteromonas sp. SR43-3]